MQKHNYLVSLDKIYLKKQMMTFFKSKTIFLPLAILSGILMFLGWPTFGLFPLLFVGLVPLFYALEKLEEGFCFNSKTPCSLNNIEITNYKNYRIFKKI